MKATIEETKIVLRLEFTPNELGDFRNILDSFDQDESVEDDEEYNLACDIIEVIDDHRDTKIVKKKRKL